VDIENYEHLDREALARQIRSLSRSELDEKLHRFGTQYALLCQRLEALYSPGRLDRFIRLRPGGLDEIDEAIAQAGPDNPKELTLLKSFRELNRVLLPFMDVYEEQVLADLKYMSKEELQALNATVSAELAAAAKPQIQDPANYRAVQNSAGTLRLATLMKDAIRRELKDRFGYEPE
jgi:hypothetical protein